MRNLILSTVELTIIVSANNFAVNAYIPSLPRDIHREHVSTTPAAIFLFAVQTRARGRIYNSCLHSAPEVDDPPHHYDIDAITYRPVRLDDIPECCRLSATTCEDDEIAEAERLRYMQMNAGDYFWCAVLSADEDREWSKRFESCAKRKDDIIIGFIYSTRLTEFTEASFPTHDHTGLILAIHSVVVDSKFRYQDVAIAMIQNYLKQILSFSSFVDSSGFQRIQMLAQSEMLSHYVDTGFLVLRPSPILSGKIKWYELEARREILESMISDHHSTNVHPFQASSRSTSNPDEGFGRGVLFAERSQRRARLHKELSKLGIDPNEIEQFGTAAIRTYNSFLLPKSVGALAVAESPTRSRVVANSISFLAREFKADQERWLRNIDKNRTNRVKEKRKETTSEQCKHPITIVLDNIRSAHNVGNILRLAEAANIDSVRLCGMTPRPPHPKV